MKQIWHERLLQPPVGGRRSFAAFLMTSVGDCSSTRISREPFVEVDFNHSFKREIVVPRHLEPNSKLYRTSESFSCLINKAERNYCVWRSCVSVVPARQIADEHCRVIVGISVVNLTAMIKQLRLDLGRTQHFDCAFSDGSDAIIFEAKLECEFIFRRVGVKFGWKVARNKICLCFLISKLLSHCLHLTYQNASRYCCENACNPATQRAYPLQCASFVPISGCQENTNDDCQQSYRENHNSNVLAIEFHTIRHNTAQLCCGVAA